MVNLSQEQYSTVAIAEATVVVWNLGKCHGRLAYRNIEWFFPAYRQHFKPNEYIDVCNGTYYPKP